MSTQNEEIVFPSFGLTIENVTDLDNHIIKFLKEYIFVSDLELSPQLITLNSIHMIKNNIEEEKNQLNTVYGFIVNHTNSINNCYWTYFDYTQPMTYSNLLFEVIQKLK
ncbi:MAG: hypothetical protein EBZ62_00275 [Sphingobacteriia bacterium]|nr:hypothetical protein [Sphingobacteriia bacterium]